MFGEWWWVRGVMFSRDDDEEPKPVQWKLDGGDICELVDLPAEYVIFEGDFIETGAVDIDEPPAVATPNPLTLEISASWLDSYRIGKSWFSKPVKGKSS